MHSTPSNYLSTQQGLKFQFLLGGINHVCGLQLRSFHTPVADPVIKTRSFRAEFCARNDLEFSPYPRYVRVQRRNIYIGSQRIKIHILLLLNCSRMYSSYTYSYFLSRCITHPFSWAKFLKSRTIYYYAGIWRISCNSIALLDLKGFSCTIKLMPSSQLQVNLRSQTTTTISLNTTRLQHFYPIEKYSNILAIRNRKFKLLLS